MKKVVLCLGVLLMASVGQGALIQHLDASLPGSVVTDGTGLVLEWIDQSGSGNNGVQARDPVLYPSTSVSASGLAGLDLGTGRYNLRLFESADTQSWLNFGAGGPATGGFAILIAFKADSVLNTWNDLLGNSTTLNTGFVMRYGSNGVMHISLEGTIQKNGQEMVEDGDTIVYAFNYDATTGAYEFWDSKNNSSMTGTKAAADFTTSRHVTLGTTDNSGRYVHAMVGEVKIYDDVLSAEELAAEREAMAEKWIVSGSPLKAHAPEPAIGSTHVPIEPALNWTTGLDPNDPNVPNPKIAQHNLWLSAAYDPLNPPATPEWQDPAVRVVEIPADRNPVDGSVDPNVSYTLTGLERDALYYWIVDESLEGATGVEDWDNIITGALWSFESMTSAPEVDAGSNIVTWLEDGTTTVDLNGVVTDVTNDVIATTWSVITAPGATVTIADTSTAVTTATLTGLGQYTLELHAIDSKANEGSDQMQIDVYNNACEAAQNYPGGYTAPVGDFNNDCKVDFLDFATLAGVWLDDAALAEDGLY